VDRKTGRQEQQQQQEQEKTGSDQGQESDVASRESRGFMTN